GIVGKLDDDVARTGMAFRYVEFAAPYQIAPAELFEYRKIGCSVRFEAVLIVHIDAPDPITLGHRQSPFVFDYGSIKIATGRIKIDRDLEGRYRLMLRGPYGAERHLTLSKKGFCRQRRNMWSFDSASSWNCSFSTPQSGHQRLGIAAVQTDP